MLPLRGYGTSQPSKIAGAHSSTRDTPNCPQDLPCPTAGQTAPPHSGPLQLDPKPEPSLGSKHEGQLPIFPSLEDPGGSPGSSARVPRGIQ